MNLNGLSYEKASLYGLPHIGARYTRDGAKWAKNGARNYEKTQTFCFICGCAATNCHHVVPLSYGQVFELKTPRGTYPLRSPLFALCGSGTTGCHNGFHGGARYKAKWVWDDPEYEQMWWSGELLSQYPPHHPSLYHYGCWQIEDRKTGTTITHREIV